MRTAILLLTLLLAAVTTSAASFDHSPFDALLKAHVKDGMVDYDAFEKAPEFPRYLDSLAKADPAAMSEKDRIAFWINTYNAYTIQLINKHKERKSIRNINKTLGVAAKGPWKEKLVKAGGQTLHLDNVEQDILRKQFLKYPGWQRVHFVLVCAAIGCPPLRSEAYTGDKLEEQLDDQARTFLLKSPSKNSVDIAGGKYLASPIMSKYYREDFGNTDAAIAAWLARFYPEGAEKQFLMSGKAKVVETNYDWDLNLKGAAAR